ncbi:MAG: DUF4296 domain-containing protein [Bacteroidota bacterium]
MKGPDELIPIETLSKMLIDMHMIDGIVQVHNNTHREKVLLPKEYYDSVIFKKYGYPDSVFRESIEYYSVYGGIQEVYTQVLDSLNTHHAKLEQMRKRRINEQKKERQKK